MSKNPEIDSETHLVPPVWILMGLVKMLEGGLLEVQALYCGNALAIGDVPGNFSTLLVVDRGLRRPEKYGVILQVIKLSEQQI